MIGSSDASSPPRCPGCPRTLYARLEADAVAHVSIPMSISSPLKGSAAVPRMHSHVRASCLSSCRRAAACRWTSGNCSSAHSSGVK
eukprot:1022952-Rhodomonas_salina.1